MSPLYVDEGAFATYICVNEASYLSETLIRDLEGHTLYSVSKLVKIIKWDCQKKSYSAFSPRSMHSKIPNFIPCILNFLKQLYPTIPMLRTFCIFVIVLLFKFYSFLSTLYKTIIIILF